MEIIIITNLFYFSMKKIAGKLSLVLILYPCFIGINILSLAITNLLWGKSIFANLIIVGSFCGNNTFYFYLYNLFAVLIKVLFICISLFFFLRHKLIFAYRILSIVLFMSFFGILQEIFYSYRYNLLELNYFFSEKEAYSLSGSLFYGNIYIVALMYSLAGIIMAISKKREIGNVVNVVSYYIILPLISTCFFNLLHEVLNM